MNCPVCGGPNIDALLDCMDCGCCLVCHPYECTCNYWDDEPEDWDDDPEDWDDEPDDWDLWGFPETGYIGPIPNCFT